MKCFSLFSSCGMSDTYEAHNLAKNIFMVSSRSTPWPCTNLCNLFTLPLLDKHFMMALIFSSPNMCKSIAKMPFSIRVRVNSRRWITIPRVVLRFASETHSAFLYLHPLLRFAKFTFKTFLGGKEHYIYDRNIKFRSNVT